VKFKRAVPVWPEGRSGDRNQMVGFRCEWTRDDASASCLLRVAAADCYRVWCNGRHAGYGPARAAHGFARVDEWPLDGYLLDGTNHLAIEVLSYGIDSYAHAMQPPFLRAEVECSGEIVAATRAGTDTMTDGAFAARTLSERVQKVERFSKQRPFAEAYRLTPTSHDWRTGHSTEDWLPCEEVGQPTLLPRGVRSPKFKIVRPSAVVARGVVALKDPPPPPVKSSARDAVGKRVMGYTVDELEIDISESLNPLDFAESDSTRTPFKAGGGVKVSAGGHVLFDFGAVQGGFIGARLGCEKPTRVYLVFDEIRDRGPGKVFTLGLGAVALDLEAGVHVFESIEPYSLRFLRVVSMDGPVTVEDLYVREFAHPAADAASCDGDDAELARIFAAARQTFRTNAVDLFTDCPSRERGGYPCDAWFTARAERDLAGESVVERNFLENYFLVGEFRSIPPGMVPHCYPSDRLGKGQYIPNWAMWLVIQLGDYCERTGDTALRDLARPRVEAILEWFAPFHNELGLLEDLAGWVFVEWSDANNCVRAVNHPTNMVYARCLDAAAHLYRRDDLAAHAERIRSAVRDLSWDGRWFADQSVRADGKLVRSATRSETCQYHAFFFNVADMETHADAWRRLRDEWGPLRSGGAEGELVPANLLYGCMLRFELLLQHGENEKLLQEIRRVFGPQAELTGTLWEHLEPRSSCNHGFASRVCGYLLDPPTRP